MRHLTAVTLTSIATWVFVLGVAGGATLSGQARFIVDVLEHRPLAEALDRLEASTGKAINYEDYPWQNPSELEDVSTPEQRASSPGYHLMVPRRSRFQADLDPVATTSAADQLSNVTALLGAYERSGLPGEFRCEVANGTVYVMPTKVLTKDGSMRDVVSPMTTLITLPYASRTVFESFEAVLDAVSKASGKRIMVGSVPMFGEPAPNFGATQEPARDVLARLLAKIGYSSVSYRLLFDPLMGYMFNLQGARPDTGSQGPGGETRCRRKRCRRLRTLSSCERSSSGPAAGILDFDPGGGKDGRVLAGEDAPGIRRDSRHAASRRASAPRTRHGFPAAERDRPRRILRKGNFKVLFESIEREQAARGNL